MLADYGPRSEGGAGAVARSRSLRNARSKLDKKRLAFVVVSDDFSLERRSCGPEQISGSSYVETSNHRSLLLNITKEFYEYYANHTINLSPPSDLVGRWTTTVGGAVDRLGGNASPPKWKQYYNIQSALNGGLGWYILLAGWLDSPRRKPSLGDAREYLGWRPNQLYEATSARSLWDHRDSRSCRRMVNGGRRRDVNPVSAGRHRLYRRASKSHP